ncbi:MAG TPA: hypothetical protein VFW96_00705 [Thermomicrobiales bacterium]|nr:hypothetical protein [Thermomicrobiales bacterium]
MKSQAISLRLPPEMRVEIEELTQRTGRDFSGIAKELLAEGLKMRRIPGIAFADSPSGRVARVAGSGVAVFEVVRDYRDLGGDVERLREAFHWLSEHQIRAALAYAAAYPEEIQARLDAEERWTPERTWAKYPFTKPAGR